jgi:hypothetical protein
MVVFSSRLCYIINNKFILHRMNFNSKARKRISFTPIMLSMYVFIQLRNPSVQWIGQIMSSCEINENSQGRKSPETTSQAIFFEIRRSLQPVPLVDFNTPGKMEKMLSENLTRIMMTEITTNW